MHAENGIDVLLSEPKYERYKKQRWGLVTNNAAFTLFGLPVREALLRQGWNLVKLFAPEHGLTAQGEDGLRQANEWDSLTGLPVESLYGDTFAPSDASMRELDGILFDIPDVGCRFYTFLWTMTHVMESCARWGKALFVLDRPNPLGRQLSLAEGPMLDEANCSSFIGRWAIPLRHCCTLGELANYFRGTRTPLTALSLSVIKCKDPNWLPVTDPTKLSWAATSPSIPDPLNALLYPGMGLLEGLNINEGRGTSMPFRVFGAPYVNSYQLATEINKLGLPGVTALPFSYIPSWGLFEKNWCHGIQWQVYAPASCRPVANMCAVIRLIAELYPHALKERDYPTHANTSGSQHLRKLLGITNAFYHITVEDMSGQLSIGQHWHAMIAPYRIYPEVD